MCNIGMHKVQFKGWAWSFWFPPMVVMGNASVPVPSEYPVVVQVQSHLRDNLCCHDNVWGPQTRKWLGTMGHAYMQTEVLVHHNLWAKKHANEKDPKLCRAPSQAFLAEYGIRISENWATFHIEKWMSFGAGMSIAWYVIRPICQKSPYQEGWSLWEMVSTGFKPSITNGN